MSASFTQSTSQRSHLKRAAGAPAKLRDMLDGNAAGSDEIEGIIYDLENFSHDDKRNKDPAYGSDTDEEESDDEDESGSSDDDALAPRPCVQKRKKYAQYFDADELAKVEELLQQNPSPSNSDMSTLAQVLTTLRAAKSGSNSSALVVMKMEDIRKQLRNLRQKSMRESKVLPFVCPPEADVCRETGRLIDEFLGLHRECTTLVFEGFTDLSMILHKNNAFVALVIKAVVDVQERLLQSRGKTHLQQLRTLLDAELAVRFSTKSSAVDIDVLFQCIEAFFVGDNNYLPRLVLPEWTAEIEDAVRNVDVDSSPLSVKRVPDPMPLKMRQRLVYTASVNQAWRPLIVAILASHHCRRDLRTVQPPSALATLFSSAAGFVLEAIKNVIDAQVTDRPLSANLIEKLAKDLEGAGLNKFWTFKDRKAWLDDVDVANLYSIASASIHSLLATRALDVRADDSVDVQLVSLIIDSRESITLYPVTATLKSRLAEKFGQFTYCDMRFFECVLLHCAKVSFAVCRVDSVETYSHLCTMLNLHPWLVVVQTRCDMFVAAADRDLSRNKRAKQLLHHVVAKFMRFLLSVQLRHVQRANCAS
jgi:hypothetical protein